MAATTPGADHHRHRPGAVGPHPGGQRGPFGAEAHDVLPGKDHPHRPSIPVCQLRGRPPGRPTPALPAKGSPIGGGVGGLAAGEAPGRVRLQVRRLHPRGLEGEVPVAGRHLERVAQPPAAAPALDLARMRPGPPPGISPTAQPPWRSGTATRQPAGARVVGEATPAEDDIRAGPLAGATLEGRPACRPGPPGDAVPARSARAGSHAAATIVRHPVQRHRWASKADSTCSTAGSGPSAARRHRIPGVQKPHWLAARGDEGVDQPARHLRGSDPQPSSRTGPQPAVPA